MSTITGNGQVTTSSPKLVRPDSVTVTFMKCEGAESLSAINARMTANHADLLRKATENTRRLTGQDRF